VGNADFDQGGKIMVGERSQYTKNFLKISIHSLKKTKRPGLAFHQG
jgi:hypothetical protein